MANSANVPIHVESKTLNLSKVEFTPRPLIVNLDIVIITCWLVDHIENCFYYHMCYPQLIKSLLLLLFYFLIIIIIISSSSSSVSM